MIKLFMQMFYSSYISIKSKDEMECIKIPSVTIERGNLEIIYRIG